MMTYFHQDIHRVTSRSPAEIKQRKYRQTESPPGKKVSQMKLQRPSRENISIDRGQNIEYIVKELKCFNVENNPGNFALISDCVKKNRDTEIPLPKNEETEDLYIRLCGLDGTFYSNEEYMLRSWEKLYLPKPTKMEVLGILESSKAMAPFPQWVVLVGENGYVYGYEDEVLHLFATSLKELLQVGIKNTGIYYEYPEDISDEEEEVLQKNQEIQKIREKTKKIIERDGEDLDEFLDLF